MVRLFSARRHVNATVTQRRLSLRGVSFACFTLAAAEAMNGGHAIRADSHRTRRRPLHMPKATNQRPTRQSLRPIGQPKGCEHLPRLGKATLDDVSVES
jgi:hypothetical protein